MHTRQRLIYSLGLLVVALLFTTIVMPKVVLAGEMSPDKIRLAVQPGLSGLYKSGFATGLNITIINEGEELKGLLVVRVEENERQMVGPTISSKYQKVVEIPAGGIYKTNLTVPGDLVSTGPIVQLVVNGKVVAVTSVQGTAVNGGLIALSLGEKPLRGGIAAWLDQTFEGQTAIKYLSPNYLPEDPLELTLADIIIVDDQAVSQLSASQVGLLKDWVSLGGMMIISGGAGTYKGGPLVDISPVIAEEQKIISADMGGLRVVKGTMQVTTGKVTQGEIMSRVNGVVVVASRSIGNGRVVYSGIPLENLTSESAAVWPTVFGQQQGPSLVDIKGGLNVRHMGNDMLSHVAGYLPQLQTPPVPKVAAAWFIYVLVVGPGLYLVLKRYDKRDWMWWMIPCCALVTTGLVYFMSPAQRINAPISHTLAVVDILNPKMAEVNATAAFVSPYGGTLNVQGPEGSIVWPSQVYYNDRQKSPIIQYEGTRGPIISFPDVEYWSMRQARATAIRDNLGFIDGKLQMDNGQITGTLVNHTSMDLKDCRVVLGGRSFTVGNFPAGGSLQVNQSLKQWPVSIGPNEFRVDIIPQPKPGEKDLLIRERQMVEVALGSMQNNANVISKPIFLGWTENPLDMFKIIAAQKKEIDYGLALVKQDLQLDFPSGKVIELSPGMLNHRLIDSRGAFNKTATGYTIYEGSFILGFDLERPLSNQSLRVMSLDFPRQENNKVVMRIHDWQEGTWFDLPSDGFKIGPEELKRYRSSAGELRLQIEKKSNAGYPDKVIMPAVSVEGVVSQ